MVHEAGILALAVMAASSVQPGLKGGFQAARTGQPATGWSWARRSQNRTGWDRQGKVGWSGGAVNGGGPFCHLHSSARIFIRTCPVNRPSGASNLSCIYTMLTLLKGSQCAEQRYTPFTTALPRTFGSTTLYSFNPPLYVLNNQVLNAIAIYKTSSSVRGIHGGHATGRCRGIYSERIRFQGIDRDHSSSCRLPITGGCISPSFQQTVN